MIAMRTSEATVSGTRGAEGREFRAIYAAAFVLFRVFDIAKPPPIDGLQNLPKGWGVLADDLAAGAAAGALLLAGRAFLA